MFTRFDPDPDITDPDDEYFGTGTWTYEDGTSTYGQGDREEAMRLWQSPGAADTRTAEFSAEDAAAWAAEGGQQAAPPVPGTDALKANAPRADVSLNGAITGTTDSGKRPSDSEVEGRSPGNIVIPKASRIAYVHNNPGNLKFVGQEGASQGEPAEDGGHWAAFETPEEGVAALNRQVQLDASRGMTARDFVTKYAPPGSNDTETYIQQASEALGVDPGTPLSQIPSDRVVAFIAKKESGTELGGTSLPEVPAAPRAPMMPGSVSPRLGGMPLAAAEVRGVPLSPDQIQQRQQGVYDQAMTQVAGVQNAAAERQRGREEALGLVKAQHDRFVQDQQQQLAMRTAARAEAERNVQSALATQLEPGRIIKQMSTGDVVLGVLALALGGLGQTLQQRGGQRNAGNAALSTLEKAIADDIEQQKDDKKSRVAHWTRVFQDEEMGIRAARAEMFNAAGQFAQFQAQQKAQNADIQAQMMQDSAMLLAKGQEEAAALVDKENERVSVRYQVPEPPKDGASAVDTFTKQLAARKAYEEAGATPEQLAIFDKALNIPTPAGESVREQKTREDAEKRRSEEETFTVDEGKAEAATTTIGEFATRAGLVRDPATGKWTTGEGIVPPALLEKLKSAWGANPFADKPIDAAMGAAAQAYGRLLTGAVVGPSEEPEFRRLLGAETATRDQLAERLNLAEATIHARRPRMKRNEGKAAPTAWK